MSPESGKVIWIVNHYAGSRVHGMEYRHYYLAQQFRRMGLRPVVICASFHHLLTKLPETRTADVEGVPYVWIKTCHYEGNGGRRVLNMVEFSIRLALRSLRELPRPDVVIASSPHPFVAVNGHRLAKKYGAKFIFEVRDLWPLTILEVGGHSPRHPFVGAMAWAERLGYERCDYTVSLLGGAREYMVSHGLDEQKFVYIPNGVEPEVVGCAVHTNGGSDEASAELVCTAHPTSNGVAPESLRRKVEPLPVEHGQVIQGLKNRGRLIILYSGSHGVVNALENVVEAARLLTDETKIHFLLVGQGPEKERLQRLAQQAELKNLTLLPPVARAQMAALTQAADCGYIGLQKKDLFRYGVSPNKLFEYMGAGLPILFAIDTIHDEVAEAQCGFSIPAEDPAALARVVRQIAQMPRDDLRALGERGRQYVQRTHSYETLAQQYARLF